ncbi:hypothetical protein BKA70DRAFT_1528898 [Coprinopsis sp. MPI-PUGE-AT-0042]|nr:hypothetical protein BKA70DRAFT_1528898 [Coprinopsis sp. MPI-PUGE-AT-0042]
MTRYKLASLLSTTVGLSLIFSQQALGIGQQGCVLFQGSSSTFPVVASGQQASPIYLSADDYPGVHIAAADFAADIQRVTDAKPALANVTASNLSPLRGSTPILVGTLGKSSLIAKIVNDTGLDVSSIEGKWESFLTKKVDNPLPGVSSAYVIIGSDKRGTIYALYDHSEQFVKYRGIFLNDEQPALTDWAMEKFTNGTGSPNFDSPFNHFFFVKVYELLLRLKGNYLWPPVWGSAFSLDDPLNQPLADYYGVVMGTSHHEPMARSTPNEFTVVAKGKWDYVNNKEEIQKYWLDGVERAKTFETVYTLGMRGFGDLPLSEELNIELLEGVIADQTNIFKQVFGEDYDVTSIPQVWTLYNEVEGYYDKGLRVPDYVTLLWSDDNWGNIRRLPTPSERNRTGGAGVYYHFDSVGGFRNYKWVTTTQLERVYEQMSLAIDREATRLWVVNVGDLKPYEREIEYFMSLGWNSSRWTHDNVDEFVSLWAQREFDVSAPIAGTITEIVGNLTRFNARRKPELMNPTSYSLLNYREADRVRAEWDNLVGTSTTVYDSLSASLKPAFFQMVHHPVTASANLAELIINAGLNNLRASQASQTANTYADTVEKLFDKDYDIEQDYHTLLGGKWNQMMKQTHLGYYYWQQPMANTAPPLVKISSKRQALPGVMRVTAEGSSGAWPGDNKNNCGNGYNCGDPTLTLDNFDVFGSKYLDIGSGGPSEFQYTITANSTWVKISQNKGTIKQGQENRIYFSVANWNALPAGRNAAVVSIVATASGQKPMTVRANFVAIKNTVSSGFKGFVEGAGVIAIEAAHASRNSSVGEFSWKELPRYGRTRSAITPLPRTDKGWAAGSGPTIEYNFFNFNTKAGSKLDVTVLLAPAFNAATESKPLAFGITIDSQPVKTVTPVGRLPKPGDFPPGWGTETGWVANAINPAVVSFSGLSPGAHTLKISAMEAAVVIQKMIIDTGGLVTSYLGPPESLVV